MHDKFTISEECKKKKKGKFVYNHEEDILLFCNILRKTFVGFFQ